MNSAVNDKGDVARYGWVQVTARLHGDPEFTGEPMKRFGSHEHVFQLRS